MESNPDNLGSDQKKNTTTAARNIGITLILASGVCFFTMLAVPWFPGSVAWKSGLGVVLFVGVQTFWWIGAGMVGPAAVARIRSLFQRNSESS